MVAEHARRGQPAGGPFTPLQAAFLEAVRPTPAGRPSRMEDLAVIPPVGPLEAHGCLYAAVIVYEGRRVWYPCRSHTGGLHHFAAMWPDCEAAWCRLSPQPGHLHDIPAGTVEIHDPIGVVERA